MSNHLAVASVTATLKWALGEAVAAGGPGAVANAKVTAGFPKGTAANGAEPAKGINIYLYQVSPNPGWRNADVPTRNADGRLIQRNQVALDLHYLLTFYGDEEDLEPQRLLGVAVQALDEHPVLTRDAIREAIDAAVADDPTTFLKSSDLMHQVELVKFTPLPLNLEELSKLWSVFFQVPYALSVAYEATVVLIEGTHTPQAAVPVSRRGLHVAPFRQPVIERAVAELGEDAPVVWDTSLRIVGERLRGDVTLVRIGPAELKATGGGDRTIVVALAPLALLAGVQPVQVVHQVLLGDPPVPHRGVESNVHPIVLRPLLTAPVTTAAGPSPGTVHVTVQMKPPLGKSQRLVLMLNRLDGPAGASPGSSTFEAPSRDVDGAPPTVNSLVVTTHGVTAGTYLVRIQVDGAESPVTTDDDPASPTFGQLFPRVTFA